MLLVAPAFAAAQGVDQYTPSAPPGAGGGAGGGPGGGGGAFGAGAGDGFGAGGGGGGGFGGSGSSSFGSSGSSSVDLGGGSSGFSLDGRNPGASGGSSGGGSGAGAGGTGEAELAEADPLSVAANRPAVALGAHASSGGIGTLPLLLGAAVLLAGIALVAGRGISRSGQSG